MCPRGQISRWLKFRSAKFFCLGKAIESPRLGNAIPYRRTRDCRANTEARRIGAADTIQSAAIQTLDLRQSELAK